VAQAIMGIPSDRRFLATAKKRLEHLFPACLARPGYHRRRRRSGDDQVALGPLRGAASRCRRRSAAHGADPLELQGLLTLERHGA